MPDDIDSFLGFDDGDNSVFEKAEKVETIVQKPIVENTIVSTVETKETLQVIDDRPLYKKMEKIEEYPTLMGAETLSEDYIRMSQRLLSQYKFLPYLHYDEIYAEMSELSIKSCPTPSLSVLNLELEKVQASKDRLSEIFVNVLKNYTFKKRAVDILRDSWSKFSNEKSADRRKGEAAFIVSDFESDFALTEAMLKSCMHILKNLDSLHDNLSRRITIIQLQLKLHDVGRGSLPDFSFDKTPSFIEEISDSNSDSKTTEE